MLRSAFDAAMRAYAKVFLLLILSTFLLNEYILSKSAIKNVVAIWACIHFLLVIGACYCQKLLHSIIADGVEKKNLSVFSVVSRIFTDRYIDQKSIILSGKVHIPVEFETVDVNARAVLEFSQRTPLIYELADTVYDTKFFRFAWLAVEKKTSAEFLLDLRVGDIILYHRAGSVIGWWVRVFTRCFWEHSGWYAGDGILVDVAPGGIKNISMADWIDSSNVVLGVLRPNVFPEQDIIEKVKNQVGKGYAYRKVFLMWWDIVSGKVGLGLITPAVFLANTAQISIVLLACFFYPSLTRLQIVLLALGAPYLFSSIQHEVAYLKNLRSITDKIYEQSRN